MKINSRKLVMWPETDLVNYHWPRSMSLTLAWQLSKLIYYIYICSNNQLHTPASDSERQAEEERDSLKPLIKMQSVIQIWTFVHINFIYSQYMRFEQLHERGLFCVKNMFFLLFFFFFWWPLMCYFLLSQVLMVGGSFALKQFASLRYDFQKSKKV